MYWWTHLSQEEVHRRFFGHELLELLQLGERLVVPLRREQDGGALELAQGALQDRRLFQCHDVKIINGHTIKLQNSSRQYVA